MSPDRTNVLLIEDEPADVGLVRRSLAAQPVSGIRVEHAPTLQAGIECLARGDVDAVLLDLNLPDSRGIDTVVRLREHDAELPVVVFTSAGDEETAVAALAAGAQDYLVKDEIGGSLLRRSIRYAMERQRIAQENERLARRLRHAERMESLGALCGGIGFGLNSLVGTIFDHCHNALAAASTAELDTGLRASLLELHSAAFRVAEMVQQLRDYAALERRRAPGEVDLARFTLEAIEFLSVIVPPEIAVTWESSGEAPRVDLGRPELHRVLVALVLNAAEAIGARRGTISISTGSLDADGALLARTHGWPDPEPGTYAFLRVADDGDGLARSRLERIFDPFYTTKFTGRGLGLAGVFGVLHSHRAVVVVDANEPSGTVFTLLFPRRAPDAGPGR